MVSGWDSRAEFGLFSAVASWNLFPLIVPRIMRFATCWSSPTIPSEEQRKGAPFYGETEESKYLIPTTVSVATTFTLFSRTTTDRSGWIERYDTRRCVGFRTVCHHIRRGFRL